MTECGRRSWSVTGASDDFGLAIVKRVLQRVGRFVAAARDVMSLEELAQRGADRLLAQALDAICPDAIVDTVADAEAWSGGDVVKVSKLHKKDDL